MTQFGGFSPIAGVDQYTPGFVGDIVGHPDKLYYIALGVGAAVYALIRYLVRTPFGLSLQGVRDDRSAWRRSATTSPLHRALAFGLGVFFAALAGVLFVWWQGQIAPGDIGLAATIELLVMAVIGGSPGSRAPGSAPSPSSSSTTMSRDPLELPVIGGSFNTIIGLIFLVIVIVSPDGLMGSGTASGVPGRRGGGTPRDASVTRPGCSGGEPRERGITG